MEIIGSRALNLKFWQILLSYIIPMAVVVGFFCQKCPDKIQYGEYLEVQGEIPDLWAAIIALDIILFMVVVIVSLVYAIGTFFWYTHESDQRRAILSLTLFLLLASLAIRFYEYLKFV